MPAKSARPARETRRQTQYVPATEVADARNIPASFESPESSSIAGARYDQTTETLTVDIKRGNNGNIVQSYQYQLVPLHLWVDFVQAPSKGVFFGERIRPIFAGRKV